MATINLNPAENYTQPTLPTTKSGWKINCLDYQILTKSDGWSQNQTKRLNEFQEFKNLLVNPSECYVALAVPYDNLTKYTNYVTDARTKGFKIWHRSHWNAWQGDNSVGSATSITSTGTTATCTTSTDHLFATGNTVLISGANEIAYNGEFVVTVTGATTFTYTMASDPDDTATGTLKWRFAKQTYLDKTYDFIVDNPTLFADGDCFTVCVECNNADGASANWTFRDTGKSNGSFSFTLYNRFLRDQVTYANAAFTAIGKSVRTNLLSFSLSLLDLNGQELDSGDTGNASGLDNADMVSYMDSIITIDHYCSNTYRDGNAYYTAYLTDIEAIHAAFPSCKIMIGEWGYHTTTAGVDGEQLGAYDRVIKVLREKSYIIGVNFWNHLGQSQSSLWTDTSGTVNPGGRKAVDAVRLAFNSGNYSNGRRARV